MSTQMNASAWGLLILSLLAVINTIGIVILWVYLSRMADSISHFTVGWIVDRLDLLRFDINKIADRLVRDTSRAGVTHATASGPSGVGAEVDMPEASSFVPENGLMQASPEPATSTDVMRIGLAPGVTLTVKNKRPGGEFSNMG